MRPISLTHSGTIGVPVEKVFALLSDPTRIPEWLPGCQALTKREGPPGKGQRWRLRMKTPRRVADIHLEVIEYSPPTGLAWEEMLPRTGSKTYFKLEFSGGATQLTMKHVWAPPGLGAWFRGIWFRRRNITRMLDGSLQNLRKILTR